MPFDPGNSITNLPPTGVVEEDFITCLQEDEQSYHSAHNYADEDHNSLVIDGFDENWVQFARNCQYEATLVKSLCQEVGTLLTAEETLTLETAAQASGDYSTGQCIYLARRHWSFSYGQQ